MDPLTNLLSLLALLSALYTGLGVLAWGLERLPPWRVDRGHRRRRGAASQPVRSNRRRRGRRLPAGAVG
jgi:hypothetical protein